MLKKFILKLTNLPVAFRVKATPMFNRFLLRLKGVRFGRNAQILGHPFFLVRGG